MFSVYIRIYFVLSEKKYLFIISWDECLLLLERKQHFWDLDGISLMIANFLYLVAVTAYSLTHDAFTDCRIWI